MTRPIRSTRIVLLAGLGLAPLAAPALAQDAPAANLTDGCIAGFDPALDYFPDKIGLAYAGNFSVEYHDSYKLVTVEAGGAAEHVVLVQCGAPVPELGDDFADATIVTIPVRSVVAINATENAFLDALGRLEVLTGVASAAYTANDAVKDGVARGTIVEFAPSGIVDVERVLAAEPDLIVTDGGDSAELAALAAAGVPLVPSLEWQEPTVLGRAEWLKFTALLLNEEAAAEAAFAGIAQRYQAAAALTADLPEAERPLVMAGAGYAGTFYAAGGRSYLAQEIADAGGRYNFAGNTDTGSTAHPDLETILDAGAEADFWLNAAPEWQTLADIAAEDPRLAALPSAQSGNVWLYDRARSADGTIRYFEDSVLRPDVVLMDLVEIFHPDLLEHDLVFYRNIEVE